VDWVFPSNNNGRDSGFHDAGVETFKGNLDRYLARELIQNSLDARDPSVDQKKPVLVEFEMLSLKRSQIPGMNHLRSTFGLCAEYWSDHKKAHAFFVRAAELASQRSLKALRVRDLNTTGVPGEDDDRKKVWYHLIRCAGSSSKSGGEGGSFGIGKNAPFAASNLRTVLYSTMTMDGQYAFQGVSTLVSHKLPDGSTAQPTGFLGGDCGQSIRILGHIPREFRRTEPGLDVIVLEYPAASSWQNDLVYSVLENFWPAIDSGDLVVTVGDQTIDRSNLLKLLAVFSAQEGFTAHLFYQAYKSPSKVFHESLTKLHEVSLYLLTSDPDLPKRIAMVRKTGMVVWQRGWLRSILPFCGVFFCRNNHGNVLLREMEPPRHDTWDPDHPSKGANKKIETEYMAFIRECIKKLVALDDTKIISIPGLNRFLPDDDETPDEVFDSGESKSKDEAPKRSPLPEKIEGRKVDSRRQAMQPDKTKPEGDQEETEAGDGDGTGGGPGKETNATDGGSGTGGGGKGDGNAGPTKGDKGGIHSKPSVAVSYRTFAKNADTGTYWLIVTQQGNTTIPVNLLVYTVGDDEKAPAEVRSARLADGTPVPIVGAGVIGPVELVAGRPLQLEVELSATTRVAMEVAAHEA
jgi:hypothetical protein